MTASPPPQLEIAGRTIGPQHPPYVVAEMSANHGQDYEAAVRLVHAAAEQGADAIKLQTYTPETMTLDVDAPCFRIDGSVWNGRSLHDLYREAQTPWAWHEKLQKVAEEAGIALFSTPFDATAVDFLESLDMPAYKIASFELADLPLVRRVAQCGRPVLLSTGMATEEEIDEAVATLRAHGCPRPVLMKCTSAYPARAEEMNLRTLTRWPDRFGTLVGLSDHSLDNTAAVAAVALGAAIVEKHLTLDRERETPDAAFSLEPDEFGAMVRAVRRAHTALGSPRQQPAPSEEPMRRLRRSLFVVKHVRAGEPLTRDHVRSIRPADGLPPKYWDEVVGRIAKRDLERGTPLRWDDLQ